MDDSVILIVSTLAGALGIKEGRIAGYLSSYLDK